MAYGIPFWAVTAVIYILAIGGVAVGIAFMLRGVLLRRGVSLAVAAVRGLGTLRLLRLMRAV